MSSVDFQNGFVCGMATKGLTRSGEYYKPLVWNDSGIYDYFYIDFKKSMEDFTLGMLQESIIVHDTVQLPITNIEQISQSIYKLYCDINDKPLGITILNKKTSLLLFKGGQTLPVFSIHIFIEGQLSYMRLPYLFDRKYIDEPILNTNLIDLNIDLYNDFKFILKDEDVIDMSELHAVEFIDIFIIGSE